MFTHRLARPLLAGMFVAGGLDSFLHPESKVQRADAVTSKLAQLMGLPDDTKLLVRVNGAVQIGAGLLMAMGVLPRPMAATLATSLVPTTIAGHAFWNETDPDTRSAQRIQFLKNASILGGLVLAANDTEGRPSVGWRAHRALEHTAARVSDSASRAAHAFPALPGP
ncbi:MAG TPA: DoxX family protein [Acidimicrobiales bacterium]|nr:DoxX family protein [Acidimicrobiales bacterium]